MHDCQNTLEKRILQKVVGLGSQYSVPVRHVEENNYLIGVKIVKAEISGPNVLLRVGGGFQTIDQFVERANTEA